MDEQQPIIVTNNGKLRGQIGVDWQGRSYFSFQGIPYGTPPVGALRFKTPQPADPWLGIKDATQEGPGSYSRDVFRNIVGSEDCLYLNVYTPELPRGQILKPVMVWIHGGGFTNGSGSATVYGPEFLMSGDVVLVTINYRLGILGFASFDDPSLEIPGNAGFKDQVLALKWVQTNIAKFCGDPENVTIFGESAGGCSVHLLTLSPLATGLFHRAIAQSGSATSLWAYGQLTAPIVSKALGLNTSATSEIDVIKIIEKMPVEEIFALQEKIPDPFLTCNMRPFGLVMEKLGIGAFLSEDPISLIKSGRFNPVSLMFGFTSREGMLLHSQYRNSKGKMVWDGDFEDVVPFNLNLPRGSKSSKAVSTQIKEFYYGNESPSDDNIDHYYRLQSDNFFFLSINNAVKYEGASSSLPVFYYRMSADTKLNIYKIFSDIKEPGTAHGDDLGYLFKNMATPDINPNSPEDITVKRVVKLWTTFAKYGDPNPVENYPLINVTWPPVKNQQLHFLDIGENLTVGTNPEANRVEFWNNIYNVHNVKCNL